MSSTSRIVWEIQVICYWIYIQQKHWKRLENSSHFKNAVCPALIVRHNAVKTDLMSFNDVTWKHPGPRIKRIFPGKYLQHPIQILPHSILTSYIRHPWEVVNSLPGLYRTKALVDSCNINPIHVRFWFMSLFIDQLPSKTFYIINYHAVSTLINPKPDSGIRFSLLAFAFTRYRERHDIDGDGVQIPSVVAPMKMSFEVVNFYITQGRYHPFERFKAVTFRLFVIKRSVRSISFLTPWIQHLWVREWLRSLHLELLIMMRFSISFISWLVTRCRGWSAEYSTVC